MMLLWVSAILSLELIALSLGLGSTRAPKMNQCTLNVQISMSVASIFHISADYGPIGFCFRHDALEGLWGSLERTSLKRMSLEWMSLEWMSLERTSLERMSVKMSIKTMSLKRTKVKINVSGS